MTAIGDETESELGAPPSRPQIVVVTGRSGAGRTTAIGILEDLGYDRVDGAPLRLIPSIVSEMIGAGRPRIAIGVDARSTGFSTPAFATLRDALAALEDADFSAMFLDGDDETLRRRYTETRRRHPLAQTGTIEQGLARDRAATTPLKELADIVIDTSTLTPNDLRRVIVDRIAAGALGMAVEVVSFAYRNGLPASADLVFDCRFLRNPHYDRNLRAMDGRSAAVAAYVESDRLYLPFLEQVMAHLKMLLPAYENAGKSYLTVAFGCTGGKHRSVALAEAVAAALQDRRGTVRLRHREIDAAPR